MKITEPQIITAELRLERRVSESYYTPDMADRTVDGVVELMAGLQESMQAVRADWRAMVASDRQSLEELAAPHIACINESRRQTNLEELQRWETFKDEHPDVADNLEDWYMCHAKLHELRKDAGLMERFDEEYRGEQMAATRAAAEFLRAQSRKQDISEQMAKLRSQAAKTGRLLTMGERRRMAALQKQLSEVDENIEIPPNSSKEQFLKEVTRLQVREWKRQLDSGLLMTEQMQTIIDETLPAMMRGEPTLFIGETGGAKTALAEYMARRYCGVEPEFVSAYGDVNSYQLIGKQELREKNGASISEFVPGPIIRAMEQGKPLILD